MAPRAAGAPLRELDARAGPAAVAAAGCGAAVLLAGVGSGQPSLLVAGAVATLVAVLFLVAGGWVDGLVLLALSLPLPALFSSDELRLAPAAGLTAVVLLAWAARAAVRPWRGDPDAIPRRSALALLVAVALSALFARDPVAGARELLNFALLLALLAVATMELRRAPRRVHRLATALAAVAGVAGVAALLESLGVLPGEFPLRDSSLYRARLGFGWPNELGAFMAMILPLAVHGYRTAATPARRTWAGAMLGFGILGLAATFSRGSWLALLAAAPVLVLGRERRLALRILLATAMAAIAIDLVFGGALAERIVGTVDDPYVVQRLALTVTGVLMFLAHPIVGVGPGGFGESLAEFGPRVTWLWDYVGTAHNAYVDMAAETGIIGLLALLAFLGTIFLRLLRAARRRPADRAAEPDPDRADSSLRLALLWSFAVACAAGFTIWPFAHGVGQLMMLVAAMGLALDRSGDAGNAGEATDPEAT